MSMWSNNNLRSPLLAGRTGRVQNSEEEETPCRRSGGGMRVRLLRPPPLPSSHLCMYYSKSSFAQKTHNVHRNGTSPPKRRVDRSRRSFLSGRLFILKRHWQTEKKFTTNSTAAAADFLGFLSSTSLSNKVRDVLCWMLLPF